jgi:hypothetical protein
MRSKEIVPQTFKKAASANAWANVRFHRILHYMSKDPNEDVRQTYRHQLSQILSFRTMLKMRHPVLTSLETLEDEKLNLLFLKS